MYSLIDWDMYKPEERRHMRALLKTRERRALAAYWRSEDSNHSPTTVEHAVHEGLFEYVVLSADVVGQLAVYRVLNNGILKRLRRLPDFRSGSVRRFPEAADAEWYGKDNEAQVAT